MKQEKYVTRKKRIKQLEKKISELEQQIETLTQLLDSVHQMLYTTRPRLARSMAREFHRIHPPEKSPVVKSHRRRLRKRNLPLAPRADLVIQNSDGHIATSSPEQV